MCLLVRGPESWSGWQRLSSSPPGPCGVVDSWPGFLLPSPDGVLLGMGPAW